MRKCLRFGFAVLLLGLSLSGWTQRTVSGKVTDDSGEGLPGVNVVIKGTSTGTTTDIDGNYQLSTNDSDILVFSFVGFTTQEVQVGSRSVIDVSMGGATELQEVVVTAFGIEREKKALSYSVQEVGNQTLVKASTPNTVNALQGKVAGVQVNQSSGMPGSSSFIRVRGSNSFNSNNQPLFVVDGLPITSTPSSSGGVSGVDYSSRSLDLNPADIESISVLKGATAAALYGLRASNGVVLITTKNGRNLEEGAFRVNVSQSYLIDEVTRVPDVQDVYAQGSNGVFSPSASTSWGPRIDQLADPSVNPFATGDGSTYVNNVGETVTPQIYDNINPMFEKGRTSVTNVDFSGATSSGNYAAGFGYTDQKGIVPTTGMRKFNSKIAGEFKLNEKISTGGSLNFIFTDIDKIVGGSNLSNVFFTTYWAPRSYDLWGTPFATEDNPYQQIHYRGAMDNPRWSLANNDFNENITRSFGNIFLKYQPLDWMTVNYRVGVDAFTEKRKEVFALGSGETGGRTSPPSGGQITDTFFQNRQINSNFNVAMNWNLTEDLVVDFLVGNEYIDIRSSSLTNVGTSLTLGGFNDLSNAGSQAPSTGTSSSRTVGFFGNATFAFQEMLYLNLTGRQDYNSTLPSSNNTFFYPSAGLTFVFTEILNINSSILSFGKIRGSYAEVGQTAPANSLTIPFLGATVGTGFTSDGIAFPSFNNQTAFRQSNILRDPNLRPQNNKTWEVGLNVAFLNGRVELDGSYFNETATDQIFTVPLAGSSGYTSILRNAGELRNEGYEITLSANPLNISDFRWDVIANFTSYNNEVVSLAPGVDNIFLGGFTEPNVRAFAGQSYPVIFGSRFLRDDNGNIVIDNRQFVNGTANASYGLPVQDPNNGPIGQVNPDFELGLTNTFSYKGLTLNVHIDIRKGGNAYAGNTRLQKLYGQDEVTEDRTTPTVLSGVKGYFTQDASGNVNVEVEGENDIAIVRGQRFWNVVMDAIDESNVYSTDFFRLREVHLAYDIPKSLYQDTFIKSLNVFVVARNLLLKTKYPNFDPETSVGGAGNFQGLEYVNLPQTRSFGFGVNVGL